MTFEQLRLIHPRFYYRDYAIEQLKTKIVITYEFILEPDIVFRPGVEISVASPVSEDILSLFAFHLGLVELISYWKAACPKEIIIEAGRLSEEQLRFWNDLYIHGLGEFFYRNDIDFTKERFLTIVSSGKEHVPCQVESFDRGNGDLVLVGGGKDSAVTLGLLTAHGRNVVPLVVNPTPAARAVIAVSGSKDPIIVRRTIDPALLALNARGYLNGHTPFSAYLAFLGVFVGQLYNAEYVVVSNEQSANEGNVVYKGLEVNHQYSKSFRFEELFRSYAASNFPASPPYFSLLRPFNNMQISRLFAARSDFDNAFRSCNVGAKTNTWCGTCAKCAFTYLSLFPFVSYARMARIFGRDLFFVSEIIEHIRGLTGLRQVKPFECVGTREESILAVMLSVRAYVQDGREIPEGLLSVKSDLHISDETVTQLSHRALHQWRDTYNLSPEHLTLLRGAWQRLETIS